MGEHAGTDWHERGWMFAQPNGKPIHPRQDYYEWKALLKEAGVREARLHDGRHTATTTLLLLVSRSEPSWTSWAGRTA